MARTSPYSFFATIGFCITAALTFAGMEYVHLHWAIAYLISVNIAIFFLYGYDKSIAKAQKGGMRIPEKILHFFALIGGTPMAFFSRRFFRHKTVKTSFVIMFWLVFIVQVFAVWKIWPLLAS